MPEPADNRMPTRFESAVFQAKAFALQMRRGFQDINDGIEYFPRVPTEEIIAGYPYVLAESRAALYTEAHSAEQRLQLGKVQNLRCAVRRLNGMELPSGETFSFWKQIGRATRGRGYVPGRQLREGCLFPAIGGGLCQLSNALYDLVLKADGTVVERHPHTRIVPGSAAEQGRDAAVAWNYIDLRFLFEMRVCLEATLTRDELVLRLRAAEEWGRKGEEEKGRKGEKTVFAFPVSKSDSTTATFVPLSALTSVRPRLTVQEHSCLTCGASGCFRHNSDEVKALRDAAHTGTSAGRVAYLAHETMPELAAYVEEQRTADDMLMLPLDGERWNRPRYAWNQTGYASVVTATVPTLLRAYRSRSLGADGPANRQAQLAGAAELAAYYARRIPWDVSHIVVAQSLLPYLWRDGHLGGRTFDVLMPGLPLRTLQARLDDAFAAHPERTLLRDFRANPRLVETEWEALQAARRIVTPHAEIAALFPDQAIRLQWQMPLVTANPSAAANPTVIKGRAVAFPGPTHARKGAYELRNVARALSLEVVLLGGELEGADFWQGVKTRRVAARSGTDWLEGVSVVVQPALVEEKPRRLLEALAWGIPVIATSACGLGDLSGVTTVPACNEDVLRDAIIQSCSDVPPVQKLREPFVPVRDNIHVPT